MFCQNVSYLFANKKKQKKRRREVMEAQDNASSDDNDSEYNEEKENDNSDNDISFSPCNSSQNHIKSKIKHCDVKAVWSSSDVIRKIGQNWYHGQCQWNNPAFTTGHHKITVTSSGLDDNASGGNPIESILDNDKRIHPLTNRRYSDHGCVIICNNDDIFPWFIIDLHDTKINLTTYVLRLPNVFQDGTLDNNIPIRWSIEGSNDLRNWELIEDRTRERNQWQSQWNPGTWDNRTRWNVNNPQENGSYSKFRIALRRKCWNGMNILPRNMLIRFTNPQIDNGCFTGKNVLAIKNVELYGNVERKAFKMVRENEVKGIIPFAKISAKKCIGDVNKIIDVINNWKDLHHDECAAYNETIPGLKVELKGYQKVGLQWMLKMEKNGNKWGIHGGLLCDEMGLGKTVQMIALMYVFLFMFL